MKEKNRDLVYGPTPFACHCGDMGSASSQSRNFSCAKALPIQTCNYKWVNKSLLVVWSMLRLLEVCTYWCQIKHSSHTVFPSHEKVLKVFEVFHPLSRTKDSSRSVNPRFPWWRAYEDVMRQRCCRCTWAEKIWYRTKRIQNGRLIFSLFVVVKRSSLGGRLAKIELSFWKMRIVYIPKYNQDVK